MGIQPSCEITLSWVVLILAVWGLKWGLGSSWEVYQVKFQGEVATEFPGVFLTNTVQQQIAFRCGLLQLTFFSSKALASHLFGDSALCAFILDWAIYYVASSPPWTICHAGGFCFGTGITCWKIALSPWTRWGETKDDVSGGKFSHLGLTWVWSVMVTKLLEIRFLPSACAVSSKSL